jgi:hypothetical protein
LKTREEKSRACKLIERRGGFLKNFLILSKFVNFFKKDLDPEDSVWFSEDNIFFEIQTYFLRREEIRFDQFGDLHFPKFPFIRRTDKFSIKIFCCECNDNHMKEGNSLPFQGKPIVVWPTLHRWSWKWYGKTKTHNENRPRFKRRSI